MITLQQPEIRPLKVALFEAAGIRVSVLRLDKIQPEVSGNKAYKLKYNLEACRQQQKKYLVTSGGAFSNHIVATAAAGKEYRITTIGIIRGDELNPASNPALRFASEAGMQLFFISREKYRMLRDEKNAAGAIAGLMNLKEEDLFVMPEGGANEYAAKGCEEILKDLPPHRQDYIFCACGTGTTLAGIARAISPRQKAIGIPVLNNAEAIEKNVLKLNNGNKNFQLLPDFHFGGYRKTNEALNQFCITFNEQNGIEIEPTYTGKLFWAVYRLAEKDYFPRDSHVLVIHSGGVYDWTRV